MRKIYTLLMLCIMTTMGAWAESTSLYERGTTTAWSDSDLGDWTQSYCTATIDGGLSVSTTNAGWTCTKSISVTENSLVTLTATIHTGGASGRSGSYDYIKIGGVSLCFNEQDKIASVDVDGTPTNLSLTYSRTSDYDVEIVIDQSNGSVSYVCGTVSGTAKSSTAISNIEFGHSKAGKENYEITAILKKISVAEEEQEVTTAGYKINYLFDNATIKSETGSAVVGNTVNATIPITIDNVRYYAAENATTSLTISDNEDNNVLNVNLREPYKKTVSIIAVDGNGSELERFSTECIEGDAAKNLFYTRVVEKDGKYYTIPAANANGVNYGKSVSYTSSDENKVYTLDETITYHSEVENMGKSRSTATSTEGAVPERASGGHWYRIYPNAHVYTDALSEGIYKIDLSARNEGSSASTLNIKLRSSEGTLTDIEKSSEWTSSENAVKTVEDIVVPEGYSIAIENQTAYNSGAALDYVIVYKTGEQITIPGNEKGLGTYVTTNALDFSGVGGLEAYIAEGEDLSKVYVTKVDEVPAGTPIIVKGTKNTTYSVPVGTCTTELTTNMLHGSATETHPVVLGEVVYAINKTTGNLNLVKTGVAIPAKKAYFLSIFDGNDSNEAKEIAFFVEEETAVSSVNADVQKADARLFNAAGQQVTSAYKGLVIDENGNKYIK